MDDLQQQTVGILLKNRRQELGLSLAEIASKTNIRRTYLEALEDDRYEALPGEAYQSGFLRNYAGALGLEAGSVLRQWRKATTKAGDGKRGEISVVSTQLSGVSPPRRLPRRRLFLLLPLLLVSAIALYFSVGSRQGAAVLQMPAPSTPALVQPAESLVSSPPGENPLPVPASATEAAVAVAEQPAAPAAVALAAVPAIPAAGSVIRLEAMGPLEVEVAVDSRPLQRYVLSTASALQWNVGRSARLAVDNPAAVKIWLGGQPLDLAGRSEIVLQAAIPE